MKSYAVPFTIEEFLFDMLFQESMIAFIFSFH